jgi:hypothetical protein
VFVGPDQGHAIRTLIRLQTVMDNRYAFLRRQARRKISRDDGLFAILLTVDEIAYYVRHGRGQEGAGAVLGAAAGSGGPGSGGRHHRRGRDSAAVVGHHPHLAAGSVRVAVRRRDRGSCV